MSTKQSRSGGKYTGSHTTVTPLTGRVCDILNKLPEVTKICLGVISGGQGSGSGIKRLKVKAAPNSTALSLVAREGHSAQEFFVYSSDPEKTKSDIESGFSNRKVQVTLE